MTGMRLPSQARTAPATPSPPISRAVSPTRTRNTSVRSMKTSKPGAASSRSRTRTGPPAVPAFSASTAALRSASLSIRRRVRKVTMAPGWRRPVASSVVRETRTRGPKVTKLTERSGSYSSVSLTSSSALPILTVDPAASPRPRASCGSMTTLPSARAGASAPPLPSSAAPTIGQASSTAFSATRRRSSPTCSIARIVMVRDSVPYSCAVARTGSGVGM